MFGLYPCPLRKLTQYICQFTSSSDLAAKFLSLYPSASGRILLASQSLIRLSKRAREVNFPLSRSAHRTTDSTARMIQGWAGRGRTLVRRISLHFQQREAPCSTGTTFGREGETELGAMSSYMSLKKLCPPPVGSVFHQSSDFPP